MPTRANDASFPSRFLPVAFVSYFLPVHGKRETKRGQSLICAVFPLLSARKKLLPNNPFYTTEFPRHGRFRRSIRHVGRARPPRMTL